MTANFYLFDVDHGQCAALHLPNDRWCIFDAGCTSRFSPISWIARNKISNPAPPFGRPMILPTFKFLKATVSHLHCDHLADHRQLFLYGPEFMRTVAFDQDYLQDCKDTSTDESWPEVHAFAYHFSKTYSGSFTPDYGGVSIREMSLPPAMARQLGGQANSRVNNASIATRIEIYGNSILLCGDLEKEMWEATIADRVNYDPAWRSFVSNVDILIAPHHGHSSAYSIDLLNLAKPSVVLISVVAKDPHVDSRYCQEPVKGIKIGETEYKSITTRKQGHVKVTIKPPANPSALGAKGGRTWSFGDAAIA